MNEKISDYKSTFYKPIKKDDVIISKANFINYGFDKHIHEDFAIGVVNHGVIDGFVDGVTSTINKKSIITVNPDTTHSNLSYKNSSYTLTSLYVKPEFLTQIIEANFGKKDVYFKAGLLDNESLANEFIYLTSLYEKGELTILDFECKLIEFLNRLVKANTIYSSQSKPLSKHDLAIFRAKEFMQDNLDENLSLEDISKQIDISKFYFQRLFKQQTHLSPHAYMMQKRVEKAKMLLRKGCSLSEVAYTCGFSDQSHFYKRFKAFMGITPGEYQNYFK